MYSITDEYSIEDLQKAAYKCPRPGEYKHLEVAVLLPLKHTIDYTHITFFKVKRTFQGTKTSWWDWECRCNDILLYYTGIYNIYFNESLKLPPIENLNIIL